MSDTRQNLATSKADSLATNLATNLAGGGAAPDIRLAFDSIQATFLRQPDDSNITIESGAARDITDIIPEASKSVSAAPYGLTTISLLRSPVLGANGVLDFTAADLTGIGGDSGLAALCSGAAAFSVYDVFRFPASTASEYTVSGLSNAAASAYSKEYLSGNLCAGRKLPGGLTSFSYAAYYSTYAVVTTVYTGSNVLIYRNGALAAGPAAYTTPGTFTTVGMGAIFRSDTLTLPGTYFDGPIAENTYCLAAHDASAVAANSAALQTYWEARGLSF